MRPEPRAHPLRFKYALVTLALDTARELVNLCATPGALAELWERIGSDLPAEDRCDGGGLGARNVGDDVRPVVMITLPPPERPNEAYHLCLVPMSAHLQPDGSLFIPDPGADLRLRVFGLERSVLPDGGLIGFVVEWTAADRFNYDAPDNGSPGAFWKAILEIFGGTRAAIHATPRGS